MKRFMTGSPVVSVLMTAFNREKYIAEAIESVLASSYKNFELIIVDDCSKDSTVAIARHYESKDARVKVYVNERNLGDYPNRNRAASYAKGKYLKYVDSDDFLYPHGLDIMVSRMDAHPTALVGLAKRSLKNMPFPILVSSRESYRLNFIERLSIFGNAPTSAIINRDFFMLSGCFSGLNQYGDYEFWLKAAASGSILLFEGDVTWDRDHSDSEKYKDDIYKKALIEYNVTLNALKSDRCPLSVEERNTALKMVKNRIKRLILKTFVTGNIEKAIVLLKSF